MNEWKKLLEQTHPGFQSIVTVDEAIIEEEKETAAPNTRVMVTKAEPVITDIEWISPTHKLQDKIKNIPDKMAFKIGEAADYVGVKQYVLRYWETEFDQLKPKKSKNGQRMYSRKDVETALLIKKLLHEDRFSIEGAQSALRKLKKQVKEKPVEVAPKVKTLAPGDQRLNLEFAESLLENIRQSRQALNL